MLNIKFKENTDIMNEVQDKFNQLYRKYYPEILGFTYFELWHRSDGYLTPDAWREFRIHPKIQEWYDEEMTLMLRSKASELIAVAGSDNSTGKAQQLSGILSQLNKTKDDRKDPTIFIYSFVPLTRAEEDNPNVRILDYIPDDLKTAMHIQEGHKQVQG